jgi:hypothetical protein
MINRHDDDATKQASEKDDDPLCGVFPTQKDRIAFRNSASLQLSGQTVCLSGNARISPIFHAIAAPLPHSNLVALCRVACYEMKQ